MESREFSANGYDFSVQYDPQTNCGAINVSGQAQNEKGKRDSVPVQSADLKAAGYEDGHIIDVAANAPKAPDNHTAQAQHLNRSEYKSVGNAERRIAASTDGTKIEEGRSVPFHMNAQGDKVAEAYMINDTITHPDGYQEHIHESFTNAPPEEQDAWNEIAETVDTGAPRDNSFDNPGFEGMSQEDIDWEGTTVREDFEPTHISEPSQTEGTEEGTPPDAGNDIGAENDGEDSGLDGDGANGPGDGADSPSDGAGSPGVGADNSGGGLGDDDGGGIE